MMNISTNTDIVNLIRFGSSKPPEECTSAKVGIRCHTYSQFFRQSGTNLLWAMLVSKKSHQRSCVGWEWQTANNEVQGLYWYQSQGLEGHTVSSTFLNNHRLRGFPWPPQVWTAIKCLWARLIKGDTALSIPFLDAMNSAEPPPFLSIDCKDIRRSRSLQQGQMRNI